MLIRSFLDYLRYERNYSDYTIKAYSKDLSQFEDFVKLNKEGIFRPEEIDADLIRNWIVELLDNKIAAASVNRKLSSLKSFFKFIIKQKVISVSPMRLIAGPKMKKKLPAFVREGEMDLLLDGDHFAEGFEGLRDRLILEMLYDTGVRRSELVGLRNSDVDSDAAVIRITGKRNKQRLIPIAENLKDLIFAYTEVRNQEVGKGEWFFVRKTGAQLSTGIVYYIVNKHLGKLPALAKRSPHVLRHSFATSMLNNGAELNAVKELLGHTSLASTSIYTHTTFEELKKVYHAHPRAKKEGG
ncbi:MAG: tyrosine-type recombinase/integrase [Tannerellaceae bacterium]|nr:tyrosine-type recombinase/integrase [Tannerellaceae bacterium]